MVQLMVQPLLLNINDFPDDVIIILLSMLVIFLKLL